MGKCYSSCHFVQTWFCEECGISDRGGFPPALKHHRETGHVVGVHQHRDYIIGE